jgi:hypothetical protein
MDRDPGSLSPALSRLVAVCRSRRDSYWEFIATAAGDPQAVAITVHGLTREELDRGAHGDAIAPSIVRERVEALAAWNPARLAELASRWRKPAECIGDPYHEAAWSAAERHLSTAKAAPAPRDPAERDRLAERLTQAIPGTEDARDWIPLIYSVLSDTWIAP